MPFFVVALLDHAIHILGVYPTFNLLKGRKTWMAGPNAVQPDYSAAARRFFGAV